MRGRESRWRLKASSNSSRRLVRVRAPDGMNFDLQMKSQLRQEFRARQSSRPCLCFRSLSRRAPIIRSILPSPISPFVRPYFSPFPLLLSILYPPSVSFHFFLDLHAALVSFSLSLTIDLLFLFCPLAEELPRRMPDTEGVRHEIRERTEF